ncbi:DUF4304 domain-containing protein [Herbaspirillum sp. ST 5-3]|uniref:DUF4304 domain-containing protein n=1 Tax=Oxalobacteraceae TaxID=75682 RepID=UPI0010A3600A|nr:DUF4304 domain-containing protein [Herbaspirillum sp. ST 5-3]
MSREGDLIRRELKKHVIPRLEELGFSGKGLYFQRKREVLDLLDFQYWKYGGEFLLEFASCELGDLKTSWGEIVPENKITVAHISPLKRARLQQQGPTRGKNFGGFAFEGFADDQERYESLARQVAMLLPQVDLWLRIREVGSHVHVLGAA